MIRTEPVCALLADADPSHLPSLVKRAADQLASATSAAEVLEARDMASIAYDASKKAARLAKAKGAHDEIIAKAHRAQADALLIESEAKRRLADEYDAAQERGEIATGRDGPGAGVLNGNAKATAAEVGLSRKDIHEARTIRDAEKADPGIVARTLEQRLGTCQEPTKAALREAVQKVRNETRENLPQAIKDMEIAKQAAIEARKAKPADVEALTAEIEELREANAALEADVARLTAENKLYGEMTVQFKQGGFEKVLADKDEEIRVLKTRLYGESADKASWMKSAKYWQAEALKLGWKNGDFTLDPETGEVADV